MADDRAIPRDGAAYLAASRALESFGLPAEEAALAAEIAELEPELAAAESVALFRLILLVRIALGRGSTRLPVTGAADPASAEVLEGMLVALLDKEADVRAAAAIRALLTEGRASAVIGAPGDYRPLIFDGRFVATQQVSAHEARLAEGLAAALARTPEDASRAALDAALAAAEARAGVPLAAAQRAAVGCALEHSLAVITGGPGTGKTSIVAAILHGVAALGVPPAAIALAAPTGKAAFRMDEAVKGALDAVGAAPGDPLRSVAARTLHGLLGYQPRLDRFRHHARNPLPERVVVVDEASMIDVFLMERLIAATAGGTRLVLLGDADQLPSVEAGAVFRDLVAAGEPGGPAERRVVRLRESFRARGADAAGRAILETAARVNAGDADGLLASAALSRREAAAALAFEGVEAVFDATLAARDALFTRWLDDVLTVDHAFRAAAREAVRIEGAALPEEADQVRVRRMLAHHERGRVLCLTHRYATGVEAANRSLHAGYARRLGREAAFEFLPGEPVMVLVNDHARGLMNGDTGVAVFGRGDDGSAVMHAVFPRGRALVAYPLAPLRSRLARAWALTVHKSQGSEFGTVGLLLPPRDLPLLTRELIYTAITRARRSVVVLGAEARLAEGVRRAVARFSGVRDRLDGRRPGETPF